MYFLSQKTVCNELLRYPGFGTVRRLMIDGEPYFVGKDIAKALGYSNAGKAVMVHVDARDKQFVMVDTPLGKSRTAVINESGLYSLVLSSRLLSAKRFKRWLTSTVLPSIRKCGMYSTEDLLANPDVLIKALTDIKKEQAWREDHDRKV